MDAWQGERQGETGCRHQSGRTTLPYTAVDGLGEIPSANPSLIHAWSTCPQAGRSLDTFLDGNVGTKLANRSGRKGGGMEN